MTTRVPGRRHEPFRRHAAIFNVPALALVMAFAALLPALAANQTTVKITVKDEKGEPVVGMEVVLQALDTAEKPLAQAPLKAKTSKQGTASFPFLTYNAQGEGRWDVSIGDDTYYVKHFRIESRQRRSQEEGKGTLIQGDENNAVPRLKLPPLMAKPGGHAEVDLTIALVSSYVGHAAGGTKDAEPAAPVEEDPLSKARALMAASKYAEAEELLKTLKQTNSSVEVEFALAQVYHLQERIPEEKAALREVLAKDPAYPKAHLELGRMAYEEGKTAEAISEFELEVKAHPDDAQTGAVLAGLYAEAGRTDDAIRVLEGIAASDSSNTDVLVSLDGLYTGKGETQKSEEIYKKVLARNPEGADQIYYRVGAQITKKSDLGEADRARAMAAFNKAIQLNPRNPKAHRELGYLLLGAGKIDEAKKQFQSYLEIDPAAKDASSIKQFLQGG